MKKTALLFLTLLFGNYSQADNTTCPDLSGNYTCRAPDNSISPLTITQSVSGGITSYNYSWYPDRPIIADNQVYPIADTPYSSDFTSQAFCEANKLHEKQTGKLYFEDGTLFGELVGAETVTQLTANGKLKQKALGVFRTADGDNEPLLSVTCERTP